MKNLQAESQQWQIDSTFLISNDLNSPFSTGMTSSCYLSGAYATSPCLTFCLWLHSLLFPPLLSTFLWVYLLLLSSFGVKVWYENQGFFLLPLYFACPFRQGLRGENLTSGNFGQFSDVPSTYLYPLQFLIWLTSSSCSNHTSTHTHFVLIPVTLTSRTQTKLNA